MLSFSSATVRSNLLLLAAALSGCAFPVRVHVPSATAGIPVYSRCTWNTSVPIATEMVAGAVRVQASLERHHGDGYVVVRFTIPVDSTVRLLDRQIQLDRRDGSPMEGVNIDHVSPLGAAHLVSFRRDGETRFAAQPAASMLASDAPLIGGRTVMPTFGFAQPYWVAARHAEPLEDVWVHLPSFTVNGSVQRFQPLHFERRTIVAVVGPNC